MATLTVIDGAGASHVVDAEDGQPLMVALNERGLVEAICRGGMSCGTCAIAIPEDQRARFGAAEGFEQDLLAALDLAPERHRLSCQCIVDGNHEGGVVHVAC